MLSKNGYAFLLIINWVVLFDFSFWGYAGVTMIEYDKFKKSLCQLELQFANYQSSGQRADLSELDKEAIADCAILTPVHPG